MADAPASSAIPEAPPHPTHDEDGLDELRHLLIGPEQTQLIKLQQRLDDPQLYAQDVSRALPGAIALRQTPDPELTSALLPTVEEAIQVSVKKDPQTLVDALFPVIGPAIRKAIAEALSSMIASLNQTLEHSLSPQSLKWRWQAFSTGRPFAEIVLLNTLVYRVEQVFLIHKQTGLLLQHVTAPSVVAPDADLVSAMLTAIQDFVRDSFQASEHETLDTLQMGELTVWAEQGPYAVVAGAIRGNAPPTLREQFKQALENIHRRQSDELKSFAGDATPFEASRGELEALLQAQYAAKGQKTSPLLLTLAVIILAAFALWAFFSIRDYWRWTGYVNRLRVEPGIVVTTAEKSWGSYFIAGLRDPLARDPAVMLAEARLDPQRVTGRWEPYQALIPPFILARARALLAPPDTVTLKVENGTLVAAGLAPHPWIVETRKLVRAIPGITQFKEDQLLDEDLTTPEALKAEIEKRALRFLLATTQLVTGQDDALQQLVADVQKLERLAAASGQPFQVEIVGHTDQTGSEESKVTLSQQRAGQIRRLLVSRGIKSASLKAVGVGDRESLRAELTEQDREFNRSVSFRVILTSAAERKAPRP
jgi:OOP family OmpA-OmpF porin